MGVKKVKPFVGLYITADRLEAAVVGGSPSEPVIETQYLSELPPDLVDADGAILDVAALGAELKRFWKESGLRNRRVVLVIDSRKALLRQIRLPKMPINSLDQAILSEAEQFALYRDEEPLIDYFVNELEHEFIQTTYGVVPEETVNAYSKALKTAGLNLIALDLAQLAGQRGMEFYHPLEDDHWTGVMVQPQRLIISCWMERRLWVMREIILPERISHDMAMLAQSYLPNIAHSVASDTNSFDDPHMVLACDRFEDARVLADHAKNLLEGRISIAGPGDDSDDGDEASDPWGDSVDTALDGAFGTEDAFAAEDGFALTATLPQASPDADDEADEAEDRDVEDDLEDDLDDEGPQISYIALGAALWGRPGVVPSLNLLPKGKSTARTLPKLEFDLDRRVLIGLVATLLVGAALTGWQVWQKGEREAQVKGLMRQLADAQVQMQGNQQMMDSQPPEAELLKQWIPHLEENVFARQFLETLRETTPSDAWISEVRYTAGKEIVLSGGALSQTSCLYFADQIATLDRVRQVKILKIEKSGASYTFEIQAGLGSQTVGQALP